MRGLISGVWHPQLSYLPKESFSERHTLIQQMNQAGYHHWIESDVLQREADRFHLYVSYACPFAHRVILTRALLGLENTISMSVLDPYLGGQNGWRFATLEQPNAYEEITVDELYGSRFLYEIYLRSHPTYTGRVTVPVLWDKATETIVSTNSADIMRMLNLAFGDRCSQWDLYPLALRPSIDQMNERIAQQINLGVYRVGTATSQASYEAALTDLFDALAAIDAHLEYRSFLVGEQMTEADCLLFTTAVRFDIAYYPVLYTSLKIGQIIQIYTVTCST